MADAGKVTWNLDLDTGKFDSGISSSKSAIKGLGGVIDNAEGVVVGFGKEIAGIAWNVMEVGATAAIGVITALGIKGVSSGTQLQSLQISMNGLTQSMDLGAKAMAGAYAYAQKAPFQLPDVAATTKTLIAYGMSADAAVGSLESLGNVSITTGVPLQALGSIFGQVSAQGKLMLGDIRQLTQNGVAILPALQKEFGKTAQEVQDMATAGEISFDQFNIAMKSLVDPTILDQLTNTLPRQMDRLNGSIRLVSNAFVGVGVSATTGFHIASDGIQQAVTTLVKNVADTLRSPEILQAATQVGNSIAPIITNLSSLIQPLVGTVTAIIPPLLSLIGNVSTLLQPLLTIVATVAPPLVSLVSDVAAGLTNGLQALMPGLTAFFNGMIAGFAILSPLIKQVGGQLGSALGSVLEALAPALQPLAAIIAALLPPLVTIVSLVAVSLSQAFAALVPAFIPIANAIGGGLSIIAATLEQLSPVITLIGNAFSQIAVTIGAALVPVIDVLSKAFANILIAVAPLIQPLLGLVVTLVNGLAPILGLIVPLITTVASAIIQFLTPVIAALTPIINELSGVIGTTLNTVIAALIPVFNALSPVLQQVGETLGKAFGEAIKALAPILPIIGDAIGQLAVAFGQILTAVIPIIPPLVKFAVSILREVLMPVLKALQPFLGQLVKAFMSVVNALLPIIPPLIKVAETLLSALAPILPVITNAFIQLMNAILPMIPMLITSLAPVLPMLADAFIQILTAMIPLIPPLITIITALLPPLISLVTGVIGAIIAWDKFLMGVFIGTLQIVIQWFTAIMTTIYKVQAWFENLGVATGKVMADFVKWISNGIGNVLGFFGALPGGILRAIGDIGSVLYDAGKELINGLLSGAGSLLPNIGKFFLDKLPDWIRDPFKKAMGIHSPSTVFAGFGMNLGQGLVNGLASTEGMISNAMSNLSDKVNLDTTMNIGASANGSGAVVGSALASTAAAGARSSQQSIVIHLNPSGIIARSRSELRDISKDMIESINEELRARRIPELGGGAIQGSSTAA